ncbi:MAG: hypothetical protein Q4D11_01950 [Rhodospirillales bacterium]|nr:hypothetical protein [Rhodospirillales bacterium]
MKKINLITLGLCFILSACHCVSCNHGNCENYYALFCNQPRRQPTIAMAQPTVTMVQPQKVIVPAPVVQDKITYYVVEQDTSCVSESAVIKAPTVSKDVKVDANEYKSFSDRVSVKEQNGNTVTYEYRDIQVDEMMPLAAHYCREHGNRTAIMRKINLYHGYYRRVTFDCVNL